MAQYPNKYNQNLLTSLLYLHLYLQGVHYCDADGSQSSKTIKATILILSSFICIIITPPAGKLNCFISIIHYVFIIRSFFLHLLFASLVS